MRPKVPEYSDPSTWTSIREREVWSEREAEDFQRELISIAGLNLYGEPNLTIRWATNYLDPMMRDGKPKYFFVSTEPVLTGRGFRDEVGNFIRCEKIEDVPLDKICLPLYTQTHLGERRFIVEIWRSPEFLHASGRYQRLTDGDDVSTWYYCRNCGEGVPIAPGTEGLDIKRSCPHCRSERVSLREERQKGEGQLLSSFPAQGCYDFFYRIERENGTFHPPDATALSAIGELWKKNQRSFKEKDAEIRTRREAMAQRAKQRRKEIFRNPEPLTEEEIYAASH